MVYCRRLLIVGGVKVSRRFKSYTRRQLKCGEVAQLGLCKPQVASSSLALSTNFLIEVVLKGLWSGSSVGENAGLSRQRSRVQVPSAPPQ